MSKSRSAYLKVFPLVFMLALVITAMRLYREYHQQTVKDPNDLLEWTTAILQISSIWVALGLVHLYKMKTIQEPPAYVRI